MSKLTLISLKSLEAALRNVIMALEGDDIPPPYRLEANQTAFAESLSKGRNGNDVLGITANERVRYAKDTKGKKAVLFTRKLGNGAIYWGIARCNRTAGDKFDRDEGIALAKRRATDAQKFGKNAKLSNFMSFAEDGLAGYTTEAEVLDLLEYFYDLTAR